MNPVLGDLTNILPKKRVVSGYAGKGSKENTLRDEVSESSKRICLQIGLGHNTNGVSGVGNPTLPHLERNRKGGSSPGTCLAVDPEFLSIKDGDDKSVSNSLLVNVAMVGKVELPSFPNSRSHELKICSRHQDNGGQNQNGCTCSFCIKAAYILSDLHHQDMKGRLATLKKSQKEAANLVSKYTNEKQLQIFNPFDKLDSHLSEQWTVLFQHMNDLFSRETLQLQSNFLELKGLRDDCKTQLERITGPQ